MSQKVTINGSFVLANNGDTYSVPLSNTVNMSSSLFNASSQLVTTGSWQTIDQNKNNDFRTGVFTNQDTASFIKLAITNTGSYQILWPGDQTTLNFSGSTPLYAQTVSGTALLTYMLVSRS